MEDNLLKRSLRQLLIAHSRQLEGSWRVSQGMCYSAPDKSHCARDMSSFDVVIAHMPKSVGFKSALAPNFDITWTYSDLPHLNDMSFVIGDRTCSQSSFHSRELNS